ncbi:MAG: hypothetical protein RPU34_10420 [Candidatus Sedimenticola sp. (ex Thyasira tokunagai)]
MSRPKKTLKKDQYEVIRDMAARGCREIDIARASGVSYNTWMRIKDEDPRALDALEEGRGIEHQKLVGALFEAAMKGNAIAAMFLLKTRHGYREGFTVEHNSNVKISVELPAALSADQYTRVIEHQTPALPGGEDET